MINIRSRRMNEKDLLAFCNELMGEIGGGGKDGMKFGLEKKDGKETLWLFGKKIKTED